MHHTLRVNPANHSMFMAGNAAAMSHTDAGGTFVLSVWFMLVLLSPVYLFESGTPQICDYLMLVLFVMLCVLGRIQWREHCSPLMVSILACCGYAILSNLIWYCLSGHSDHLTFACYYLFALLTVLVVSSLEVWFRRRFIQWTVTSLLLAIVQTTIVSAFSDSGEVRSSGLFNNPNQLGYFVVLSASMLWIWFDRYSLNRTKATRLYIIGVFAIVACLGYLSMTTMSRATIGALGVGAILFFGRKPILALLIAIPLVWGFGYLDDTLHFTEAFSSRLENQDRLGQSFLQGRGYDRISYYRTNWIFGVGEGNNQRFGYSDHTGELHSTFGSFFFCYGIVGFFLLTNVLVGLSRSAGVRSLLYMLPALAFGLAHNGIRETYFWVLIVWVASSYTPSQHSPASQHSTDQSDAEPLTRNGQCHS